MADQIIIQTVTGDRNIVAFGSVNIVQQISAAEGLERQTQLDFLRKIKHEWIEKYYEKTIYKLILIGKKSYSEIKKPLETGAEIPEQVAHTLPQDTEIFKIFEEASRALLIVGEPGSGKTFALLELTKELIERALKDPTQPIPVVLPLSTWTEKRQAIADWVRDEMSSKYGVSKNIASDWIKKQRLTLLLDGLDEVASENRKSCVAAINNFFDENGLPGLVVTSRKEEYEALKPNYLKLCNGIRLEPLAPEQIDVYLEKAGDALAGLKEVIETDKELKDIAKSPLMLSVMSLAYQDMPPEAIKSAEFDTPEKRRNKIFNTYIRRMFLRNREHQPYTNKQVIEWLSWLAQGMMQNYKTIFLIEELQPNWLSNRGAFWVYGLTSRVLFGLIAGLLIGLRFNPGIMYDFTIGLNKVVINGTIVGFIAGLLFIFTSSLKRHGSNSSIRGIKIGFFFGLICWLSIRQAVLGGGGYHTLLYALIFGLFISLVVALTTKNQGILEDIQTTEALQWSWEGLSKGGINGVILGLISGFIIGFIFSFNAFYYYAFILGLNSAGAGAITIKYMERLGHSGFLARFYFGLCSAMLSGLIFGIYGLIFGGLKSRIIQKKNFPNQGIYFSIRNAILAGLIFGIISGLTFSLLSGYFTYFSFENFIITGLTLGLFVAFLAGMIIYGGLDAVKHYILRLILWWKGYAPLNYACFLDYATELIFLRKVVGGYDFIHRMLLEHFAAMGQEASGTDVPSS
jgi:eukaryotic-like serine/threonine-protein kinase